MSLERILEPEWLDGLPAEDERAVKARADLRRVNALMGNARHIAGALSAALPASGVPRLLDLGGGDGLAMLAVARRLRRRGRVTLVDRSPAASAATLREFARLGWQASFVADDALRFLACSRGFDAVVANLFLHHFAVHPLRRLLAFAATRAPLFVACEPRRARVALHASRLLWALGCNAVTRHDATASVRAGFAAQELSNAWPQRPGWRFEERAAAPFSHLFVARSYAL